MYLTEVNSKMRYLVVTSVNGQPLDEVVKTSCRLYNGGDEKELASFQMQKPQEEETDDPMEILLDKDDDGGDHTAMVVGCLYRGSSGDEEDWNFGITGIEADGKWPKECLGPTQKFLKDHPLKDPKGLPKLTKDALKECVMPTAAVAASIDKEASDAAAAAAATAKEIIASAENSVEC